MPIKIKKVLESPIFLRIRKKFNKKQKLKLDEQIKKIIEEPEIGTQKRGALKDIFVHKFKMQTQQYLLGYRIIDSNLELVMIGTHENYYRDLQKHLN